MNPPPFARSAHLLKINERRTDVSLGLASVRDFTVSYVDSVVTKFHMDGSIIYCCDIDSERVWYTLVERPAETLAAPFLFQAQRQHAVAILSLPWELLPVREQFPDPQPVFVFSVGRCGSTLLAALLKAVGRGSVSEPDFLTQLAALNPTERRRIGTRAIHTIISAGTASLARLCGRRAVVKLRHHCNKIWGELATAVPGCRIVFMLRDRLSWARSRHRAFGDSAEVIASLLRDGVETLDQMIRAGAHPQVLWYEDLVADPTGTLRLLDLEQDGLGPIDADAVQEVLRHDAQQGTGIGRTDLDVRPSEKTCLSKFDALWERLAPRELIAKHGLDRLL